VPKRGKAPKVTVTVEGLDRLRSRLEKLPDEMRKGAEKAVRDETEEVAQDMRDSVPVDTGALRDGMQAESDGLSGKATSTAAHSWVVEAGSSKMPARPFAQPAAERSRVRFPDRVSAAVREELPT
jgi:HK97 gp10 family phage protein